MAKLGYDPAGFKGLDPSLPFPKNDPKAHARAMSVLGYWIQAAVANRRRAEESILAMARYRNNIFLEPTDNVTEASRRSAGLAQKLDGAKKPARYYSIPAIVGVVERRKALYGNLSLDFEAGRLTTGDDDLIVAEVMMHHANRIEKPELETVKWTYVDKMVWELRPVLKCYFDPTRGVAMTPRGEKPVGTPAYEPLNPLEYFIDPGCGWRGMRGARYAGDQRVMDAGEIFARFVREANPSLAGNDAVLRAWEGWGGGLVLNGTEAEVWGQKGLSTRSDVASTGVITEVTFLPSPGMNLPGGLRAIVITGSDNQDSSILRDGRVLLWEPLSWPRVLPYVDDAVEIENPASYYGDNYARLLGPLNKAMNLRAAAANAAGERMAKRTAVVTGAGGPEDIKFLPGSKLGAQGHVDGILLMGKNVETKVGWAEETGSALLQTRLFDFFTNGMTLVTNTAPAGQPQEELATQAQRAMLYEASVTGVVRDRLGRAFVRAAVLGQMLSQRYHSVKQLKRWLPDQEESELELFRNADLDYNTAVRLRRATFFQGDPQARTAFLAMLAQMGGELVEKHMPADQMRELFNIRDELGPSEYDRQVELAEAENARLRKGPLEAKTDGDGEGDAESGTKPGWIVLPQEGVMDTDDDEAHVRVHSRPLADANRHLMNPGYKRRLLAHIMAHVKRTQMAAAEQMQMAAAMQAMSGGGRGSAPEMPEHRGADGEAEAMSRLDGGKV